MSNKAEYRDTPPFVYGSCGICRQGELIAVKHPSTAVIALMCDDCESAWISPSDLSLLSLPEGEVRYASLGEVVGAGWPTPEYLGFGAGRTSHVPPKPL
jgi:hypothetical protein